MEIQDFINYHKDDYIKLLRKMNLSVKVSGDLIIVKQYKNKNYSDDKLLKYCRGCIINKNDLNVICIPPMKCNEITDIDEIINNFNEENEYQPLIDGTMINMCFHKEWKINTRSFIGANNKWLNKKTFKELFEKINGVEWFNYLDKDKSYTFVMQHKDVRNVTPVNTNKIYLVDAFDLKEMKYIKSSCLPIIEGIETISKLNKEEIIEYKNNLYFSIKGIIIKNKNKYLKWINPNFKLVSDMKINNNNNFMNYIDLIKTQKTEQYLYYYPELIEEFTTYNHFIYYLIDILHKNYIDIFINKRILLKDTNHILIPLLREIHNKYKEDNIKTTKGKIYNIIIENDSRRLLFIKNRL